MQVLQILYTIGRFLKRIRKMAVSAIRSQVDQWNQKALQVFTIHGIPVKQNQGVLSIAQSQATWEKIENILEAAGYRPTLIIAGELEFRFSVGPTPHSSFSLTFQMDPSQQAPVPIVSAAAAAPSPNHLSVEEFAKVFGTEQYTPSDQDCVDDVYRSINLFRSGVAPALTRCLSSVIAEALNPTANSPAIELGSGTGYQLDPSLSPAVIRTQRSASECLLLSKTTKEPIFQVDLQALCCIAKTHERRLPKVFALNVFDTMVPSKRLRAIQMLSELQNPGDKLVIALDVNPEFFAFIQELEAQNSGCVACPFIPIGTNYKKLQYVLIPRNISIDASQLSEPMMFVALSWLQSLCKGTMTMAQRAELVQSLAISAEQGKTHAFQLLLSFLTAQHPLKMVAAEDFYAEQMQLTLQAAGYTTRRFYQASFVPGEWTQEHAKNFRTVGSGSFNTFYRSVCNPGTIRAWGIDNLKFKATLAEKGITVPVEFDETRMKALSEQGHVLFGAEVMVIEATRV